MIEQLEHEFTHRDFAAKTNEKSFEVEEQAKLDPGQELEIQQQILRGGGKHTGDEYIDDVFFGPSSVTSSSDALEKRALGEQIIRIRKIIRQSTSGKTETVTEFTTKVMQGDKEKAWNEHTFIRMGDYRDEAEGILMSLSGLEPYYRVTKTRSEWELGDVKLTFDAVPEYGTMMEAEIAADKNGIDSAKQKIRETLKGLGVRPDQKPKKSIMSELQTPKS